MTVIGKTTKPSGWSEQTTWKQVKTIFDRVVQCDPALRSQFLRDCCGSDEDLQREVESLLACDQPTGSLAAGLQIDTPTQTELLRFDHPRSACRWRIGPYEIIRELGHGGMGTVYLARRADGVFEKQVALKIVRAGLAATEMIGRFQQERQILASLEHPHIARLLDGGSTAEGLPYLVLEYVEGKPIDQYCDDGKLNVTERLTLFQQACDVVQYAHDSGIVHRDLKPSNLLVTNAGQIKLLDFGIAKVLGGSEATNVLWQTHTGARQMTPEYASPEQVKGELITPATDVYLLGVLLYRLLTGRSPYRTRTGVFHEIATAICDETPVKPSVRVAELPASSDQSENTRERLSAVRQSEPRELARVLGGDLDNILLKCLRKEPPQRYISVMELCEDLQRYLQGQPARAHDLTAWYAAVKYVRRHQVTAIVACLLPISVSTGLVNVKWPAVVLFGAACLVRVYFGVDFGVHKRLKELFSTIGFIAIVVMTYYGLATLMKGIGEHQLFFSFVAAESLNVTLRNLNIHGMAHTRIRAGALTDWTVEDVRIAAQRPGWDGDMAGSGRRDSSDSGTMLFRRWKVERNGCAETWPARQPDHCWAQDARFCVSRLRSPGK